jgi:transcriptional regulator with XRE-family HTH domain
MYNDYSIFCAIRCHPFYVENEKRQPMTELAAQIAQAREALGLSQAQLARKAHTSQQQIHRLESGAIAHSRVLPRIAAILGLDISARENPLVPLNSIEFGPLISIYATELAEGDTMIVRMDQPIGRLPAPNAATPGTYAFYTPGDSMAPVVRAGNLLIASPQLPVGHFDLAVFQRADGVAWLGEFTGYNPTSWQLKVYGPEPRAITLDRQEWKTRHRVWIRYT